ncbi:MAG: hypothetical protein ACKPKO_13020, partial [Candidatus Fonsibacter sp.]
RESRMRGVWSETRFALFSSQYILQLALLADATYESMMLVRSMGREQLDPATMHATIATFVARVDFLCKRGGCITVESSFTQHCLTLLSTGQLQVLEKVT